MSDRVDPTGWTCPLPLRDYDRIVLGHGSGGELTSELVAHLFVPAFGSRRLDELRDAAVVPAPAGRLALTTDSFVVRPLFFPGGDIGRLAVHGTVNDLAMSGARPLYLTTGFILEEGVPLDTVGRIVRSMAEAATAAGVELVAGDTKVVERGHGDGVYINTTGVGVVPDEVDVAPQRAAPGDAIIVSGPIGDHGMAIMSVREGLTFEAPIVSDTAALHELVASMLTAASGIHALRDPTRGGLAATLHEIGAASRTGIEIDEDLIPVRPAVRAACELLGLDPLFVANEGKLVAVVRPDAADSLLACMRVHPLGRDAVIIGRVVADHPSMVVARTAIGASRVVAMQLGEQLPRIC